MPRPTKPPPRKPLAPDVPMTQEELEAELAKPAETKFSRSTHEANDGSAIHKRKKIKGITVFVLRSEDRNCQMVLDRLLQFLKPLVDYHRGRTDIVDQETFDLAAMTNNAVIVKRYLRLLQKRFKHESRRLHIGDIETTPFYMMELRQ